MINYSQITKKLLIFILFFHKVFAGLDSSQHIFKNQNLTSEILSCDIFIGCDFSNAKLNNAKCKSTSFRRANLSNISAINANFTRAKFHDANLENANLTNADFTEATFYNTNLNNTIARGAIFLNARGLTNEQKDYFIQNGAKDVPEKYLTYEDFEKELKKIEDYDHDWLTDITDSILDFITLNKYSLRLENLINKIFHGNKKQKTLAE